MSSPPRDPTSDSDLATAELMELLERTPDLVVLTDGHRFLYMNEAASLFLDAHAHAARDALDPKDVIPTSQHGVMRRAAEEILSGRSWRGEIILERHDGALVPFSAVAFAARSRHRGPAKVYAATFRDLSSQKAYELELESSVFIDELTGLANRRRFLDQLGRMLSASREQRPEVGLITVDVDRFKMLNDTLSPAAGDRLLVAIADRIQLVVRPSDLVARLAADEFVILCEKPGPDALERISTRIRESLSQPFTIARREISVTASIGIMESAAGRTDPESLLQDAIAANQSAKDLGGDRVAVFDPVRRLQAASNLDLEQELRKALRNDEFDLVYQKEVWLSSADLVCLESLIRWEHPERGQIFPDQFIPLAEATGLIVPIGEWVIGEACRQLNLWAAAGMRGLSVSVNVSPVQLAQADYPERLHAILEQHSIRPNQINLEITESVMTDQSRSFLNRIHDLRDAGFTMVMDDFGTGYSSLSQLRTLPFSVLKIDKAFVIDMIETPGDQKLVDAMIRMAHALGRVVVAEGVETRAHAEILTRLSCEMAQGWFYGRPKSGEATIEELLGARSVKPDVVEDTQDLAFEADLGPPADTPLAAGVADESD